MGAQVCGVWEGGGGGQRSAEWGERKSRAAGAVDEVMLVGGKDGGS